MGQGKIFDALLNREEVMRVVPKHVSVSQELHKENNIPIHLQVYNIDTKRMEYPQPRQMHNSKVTYHALKPFVQESNYEEAKRLCLSMGMYLPKFLHEKEIEWLQDIQGTRTEKENKLGINADRIAEIVN